MSNMGNFKEQVAQLRTSTRTSTTVHPAPHLGSPAPTGADPPDWAARGQADLEAALSRSLAWRPATNVIYFVGDGIGVSTLTAARFFKAQRGTEGAHIADTSLAWESFPTTGLLKTYSTDSQVPDSAATATAFVCGEKSQSKTICVNQLVAMGDCPGSLNNHLTSVLHQAIQEEKWTGFVTTSDVTDATTSVLYAHSADRVWVSDADVPLEYRETCWDIARQLVDVPENANIRVILGGGRRNFMPETVVDPETGDPGQRLDARNLTQEWVAQKLAMGAPETAVHYVERKSEFDAVDPVTEEYLLGLFDDGGMDYEADRELETGEWREPSLTEMVAKAIRILERGPQGYLLFVEGGNIDSAHHANNAHRALTDVLALDDAVDTALGMVSLDDTLVLVTADHSHLFNIAGDPALDNDILGVSVMSNGQLQVALDNKPYTTLSYVNGPGFLDHRTDNGSVETVKPRINLTDVDTSGLDFRQDSSVPYSSATHAGEDVALYARGPMAHLLSGQHEQSYIAHAVRYIACLGDNKAMCQNPPPHPGCTASAASEISGTQTPGSHGHTNLDPDVRSHRSLLVIPVHTGH